ncbi:MAG: threonine/serine dehydratase, partial [Synergistaceae bacterium]|nr:threonine/serine dehydratase [Synergistaceae bacterium]
KPYIKHTPLIRSENLDDILACSVYFKPECLQITGSFKARGAVNKLLSLSSGKKARGVVTASSGNHAQGVAYAGKILGVKTTVVLPEDAAETKINGCRAFGAEIVMHGFTSAERRAKAEEIKNKSGSVSIHSYDDPAIIAGQGTAGLEILDDLAGADRIVVPVGGGGLISGIAAAVKENNPKIKIIGVEPSAVPRYTKSLEEGRPVAVETRGTCADALKAAKAGVNNYELISRYVDEIVTVDDEFIIKAFALITNGAKLIAEPSSCVGVGAVLCGNIKFDRNENVVFLLSGGNIDKYKIIEYLGGAGHGQK